LRTLYSRDFVVFEADMPNMYSEKEELGRLTKAPFTPVFVFLDAQGKKVAETRGFRTPAEAKALHEYITKRIYLKTSFADFMASTPR